MKNTLHLLPAFLITSLLSACEGMKSAEGKVADAQTGLAIDSVYCNVITGNMSMYTDSTGRFNVHNRMGSCVGGCKDITVAFSKKGYKTTTIQDPEKDVTIYLGK